jgi:hypothetical protein
MTDTAGADRDTQEFPSQETGRGDGGPAGSTSGQATGSTNGRAERRAVARRYRPRRTIPAVIVAILLLVVTVLGAIEVISYLFNNPAGVVPADRLAEQGRETAWNDALTITVAVIIGLFGLLLLVIALWPGRPRAVALASDRPGVVMAIGEADLARLVARAATDVDGVDHASAQVRRGHIAVRADSPLHEAGDLADQVQRAVAEQVDELAPLRPRPVRVNVRHKED